MKNNLKTAAAILLFAPCAIFAADNNSDEQYFGIESSRFEVSVKETDEKPDLVSIPLDAMTKGPGGGIVNTGMQAWSVINSGQPSGSHSSAYASAMPGFNQWANFSNWKKKEMTYNYTVTNRMHMDVIRVKYVVAFFYDGMDLRSQTPTETNPFTGDRETAKGSYVANFTVRPVEVDIKWGFNYSLNVTMSNPMNIGSSDNPVAYLQADLNWNISTVLQSKGGILTYGVDGLGNFKDLTEKSAELTKQLPLPVLEKPASVDWN
ncbi:MAG TPA: hypothetical protein DCL44_05470 [Elusimicrobia bacterium]|nr:hypothetical protein [Elusimicrobiota bacterium]